MCHSYWIMTFDGLPQRLSEMRQRIRKVLGDVDGVDDVVVVASELASNAIRHSRSGQPGGSFVLQIVEFTDVWHVRVEDQGGTRGFGTEDTEQGDETGRGLAVVAALSRAWGVMGGSAGRTVWAEIPYPKDELLAEFSEGEVEEGWERLLLALLPSDRARQRFAF